DAAVGLWMPSVDRIGRYFPLTFAMLAPTFDAFDLRQRGGAFLASAEAAGRDALEFELAPDDIARRLAEQSAAESEAGPAACPPGGSLWWSDGSTRVARTIIGCPLLPDELAF